MGLSVPLEAIICASRGAVVGPRKKHESLVNTTSCAFANCPTLTKSCANAGADIAVIYMGVLALVILYFPIASVKHFCPFEMLMAVLCF